MRTLAPTPIASSRDRANDFRSGLQEGAWRDTGVDGGGLGEGDAAGAAHHVQGVALEGDGGAVSSPVRSRGIRVSVAP